MAAMGFDFSHRGEASVETLDFNRDLVHRLTLLPDQWSFAPSVIREKRAEGLGPAVSKKRNMPQRYRVILSAFWPPQARLAVEFARPEGILADV